MQLETVDSTAIHASENLTNAKSKGRNFLPNIRNTYPYWRFHRPVRRETKEE